MGRGKGPRPLHSTVRGFLGSGSQGFLPLAECTSLLGPYFRQEKKSIKVLTKGLPCTEGADLDSGTSVEGPSRFLASLFYSMSSWPGCPRQVPCFYRSSRLGSSRASALLSLKALPLTPAKLPVGSALPGLDGDIAWATPGCGSSSSIRLGAKELVTKKELPPVHDPRVSEPACSRPVVCPAPSRGDRPWPWRQPWRGGLDLYGTRGGRSLRCREGGSALSNLSHPIAAGTTHAAHPHSPLHFVQCPQTRSRNKAPSSGVTVAFASSCP